MKRGFERAQRVADLIQQSLAQMLLQNMSDKRFHLVTITGVTLTKDFSYAKVFVSVLKDDEAEIQNIVQALNHAAKSLRYHLAHAVTMRVVPELKFVYDASTARGFRISHLIDAAVKKANQNEEQSPDQIDKSDKSDK